MVARVRDVITRHAGQMEADRHMPLELHQELRAAGLYGIYLPVELGGSGFTAPDALRTVEAVAAIDGSAGWTVALSFAAGYFSGVIRQDVAAGIFGEGRVLLAGSGRPLRADVVDGGYAISGQLPFASGSIHADWLNGLAIIHDGGAPRMGERGPRMVGWFIPRGEARVLDTWNASGLCGTGTHDVLFENVFVPGERTVLGDPMAGLPVYRDGPMLRIPFFTVTAMVQSPPCCLGIASHALEAFREIAVSKVNPMSGQALRDRPGVQAAFAKAEAKVRAARALFYETAEDVWRRAEAGEPFDDETRAAVRIATTLVAEHCVEAVEAVYRLAGTTAIAAKSPLDRCWRDIHAAAAHIQVQDSNWEPAGRVLLGLEPAALGF